MSDFLLDTSRCPECGTTLDGIWCPGCGLLLRGPLAAELWRVVDDIARMQRRRGHLVTRLREQAAATALLARTGPTATAAPPPATLSATPTPTPPPAAVPARASVPVSRPAPRTAATAPVSPTPRLSPTPPPPARPARPPRPRREWTPQRVQNLLLLTGVLVTLSAAVIFTAFQWGGLPLWARGALMVAATAVTGYGAKWVHGRGLTSSAEALGALTVALGAVDAYAVHAAGLTGVSVPMYWTFASAAVAAGAAAFARVVPVRSVRYASFVSAHLPVLITAGQMDGWTTPQRMVLVGAQSAGLLLAARRLGGMAAAARWSAAGHWVGAITASVLAAIDSTTGAFPDDRVVGWASAALVLLAGVPLLWPGYRTVTAGLTTASLVGAALLPAHAGLTGVQLPAAFAAAGLLAVVGAASLPREWRDGPLAVGCGTVALALLTALPAVLAALLAPFGWAGDVWSVQGNPAAREVLTPGIAWGGTVVTLGVVFAAAATAAVVGAVADRRALYGAYVLAATSILLVPLGFAWSFQAALAWDVVVGAGALAAAVATKRLDAAIAGSIVLAVAGAWSLANDTTTVGVSAALAVVFAGVAAFALREEAGAVSATAAAGCALAVTLSRGTPLDRTGFVVATAAAVLLAASLLLGVRSVAVAAVVAYVLSLTLATTGAGWLAWTLALGAAVGALRSLVDERAVPVASALALACAGVTSHAFGAPQARTGFVLAVAAAALAVAALLPRLAGTDVVTATAYGIGLALAAVDPGWLAWALGAGAAAAAARAVCDEYLVPLAATLALACAGVTSHAYGASPAVTGLVVAAASALLAVSVLLPRLGSAEAVALAGYAVGLALAADDLGLLAWAFGAGAVAGAVRAFADDRIVPVPAALGLACVGVASHASGAAPARTGLVLAAAAAAVVAASTLNRLRDALPVGAVAYAMGLALATPDERLLAWALAAGAVAAAVLATSDRRAVPFASALGIACAGVAAVALGAPPERAAFFVTLAAAASVGAAVLLRDESLEWVAAVAYCVALALAADDAGWLSWVLAAGGVTALADALRPERRELAWVGGTLLTGCSWVRLFLEDVRAPEAYAAPLAVTALVLGHLRRNRDESVGSWSAYGAGLSLAFGPSLWLVLTEPSSTRALLLAVAATAVLLAGIGERLQAPLTVGAGVLVVDAIVQVAPVAAALPKWATLGTLGILVTAVGVTYEDRRRDVQRLRETYESMR